MAKPLALPCYLLLLILFCSFHHSNQLQQLQSRSLLTIQQLLNYPSVLNSFNSTTDYCSIEPTPSLTLVCFEDDLTQLHITGNNNNGFPPLPQSFSSDIFFTAVANLSSLKVLSLVSLGLSGPFPASIGQLSSLEILNVSSNYFTGSIPGELSSLRNLQTLILDHNRFTGRVPSWLSSFSGLALLSLKNNSLGGSLPDSLTSLVNLRTLVLSKNNFHGEIPDLFNLTNLQVLDLEDNHFGPHFPNLNNRLVLLVLRNNSFRSGLPTGLSSYYQLQKLDVSSNRFVGPIPLSLFALPSMNYLDISRNRLSGMLFSNISCNAELAYVDLSSNLFTGDLPSCFNFSSNGRAIRYARNCLLNHKQEQYPPTFCHNEALAVEVSQPDNEKHKRISGKAVLASSTIGATFGGIAIVSLAFLFVRKLYNETSAVRKPQKTRLIRENVSVNTVKLLSDARYISQTMKLGSSLPAYRTFAPEEIKEATNNFDAANFLGGSSQSQVHKGKLADGTIVAVRGLTVKKKHNQHAYMHQIELISKLRHTNLVSSLGHCIDCPSGDLSTSRIFLLFEFVPNGSLRHHISGFPGKNLGWTQRIAAAIGVARGIQFLNTGIVPGVFSNNVKITDVLLDHDLHVKISSYNVPLLAENSAKMDSAFSFSGYKQNICASEKQNDKKDINDLGIILLEIIVGRPIISANDVIVSRDILQVSMTVDDTARRNIIDPSIHKECTDESLKTMMELTIRCLADKPSDRPSVEDVLWNLQFAAQVQETLKGESHNSQESTTAFSQQ